MAFGLMGICASAAAFSGLLGCAAISVEPPSEPGQIAAPPPAEPATCQGSDSFDVSDWAEQLAEAGEAGVFVKGDDILVVSIVAPEDGERLGDTRLKMKFNAVQMVRRHFEITAEMNVSSAVLHGDFLEDGRYLGILAFKREDIKAAKGK